MDKHSVQFNSSQNKVCLEFTFFLNFIPSTSPYVEPVVKSPFDDIDPEYGLHGYQLHIVLHDTGCNLLSASFPQLFCHKSN